MQVAWSLNIPLSAIKPTTNQWINSLPDLNRVELAIFVSQYAVYYCFDQLKQNHINWPTTLKVIAIGQATAKSLNEWKIPVSEIPPISDSEHLLALEVFKKINQQTVLLFEGEGGRPLIEERLLQQGVKLLPVIVYQRGMPEYDLELLHAIWHKDLVDIIPETSEQSLHNLFAMFGEEAHNWLQNKPCLVLK